MCAERVQSLVKVEYTHQVSEVLPSRDFDVAYRLDCRNLCADFQEDIEFHFSLGITALMNRFLGHKLSSRVLREVVLFVCSLMWVLLRTYVVT